MHALLSMSDLSAQCMKRVRRGPSSGVAARKLDRRKVSRRSSTPSRLESAVSPGGMPSASAYVSPTSLRVMDAMCSTVYLVGLQHDVPRRTWNILST